MSKYEVEIRGVVECASDAMAAEMATKLQTTLGQPLVKMTLAGQGVNLISATVGKPKRKV